MTRWRILAFCALIFYGVTVGAQVRSQNMADGQNAMILLDAHQDCLRRVLDRQDDLAQNYGIEQGNIPLWRKGGFNAIWMSVWVDPRRYKGSGAVERAEQLIRAYSKQMSLHSNELAPCQTASEVRAAVQQGKIATMLGVEGGVAINNDLSLISHYRQLGVRYMTLTWRGNLAWAGSSQSDNPAQGLTGFGREVVREMNRVGIILDLAHVSDRTFYDAIDETSRPVIVSHSNARLLSPSPRNVSDAMLVRLRDNGGVVGVNFSGDFLKRSESGELKLRVGPPTIDTVVEQIDHIVQVAGIDHVGIGSDYDGGIRPARGLETAADAPKLISALRQHGYTDAGIRKIAGENFLRVLQANDVQREPAKTGVRYLSPAEKNVQPESADYRM
ncbi:MAG: dipeptidase [Candidatus Sumerlaeaceae bacterium]